MKSASKNEYVRPKLVVYGKLEQITQASQDGQRLDQDFSSGTDRGDLTFS